MALTYSIKMLMEEMKPVLTEIEKTSIVTFRPKQRFRGILLFHKSKGKNKGKDLLQKYSFTSLRISIENLIEQKTSLKSQGKFD